MMYLGDFNEDQEVVFYWNTNDSDGGSITRATDGTIKVRRDDGTDVTGTSVTDNEDTPDTGIHEVKVDTSDGANYTTGYDFVIWLDGSTIDGQTVNSALAHFSIENRHNEVDVTKLGGSIQSATDLKDFADAGYDPATNKVEGVKLVDTTTTNSDMRGTDSAALASVCTEARLAELDAANIPADIDSLLSRLTATRAGYLDNLSGGAVALEATLTAIKGAGWSATDNLKEITADVTGLNGDAMRGTDSAALASVCTEGRLSELDAANIPADIDTLLSRLSSARAGYLDNLNIGENVAGVSDVSGLSTLTKANVAEAFADQDIFLTHCSPMLEM